MNNMDAYAKALFEVSQSPIETYEALKSSVAVFASNTNNVYAIESSKSLWDAIVEIFESEYPKEYVQFLRVLQEDGLLHQLARIQEVYRDILIEYKIMQYAFIESVKPLSDQLKQSLEVLLKKKYGPNMELSYHINDSYLGGICITVNHERFDLTYAGVLNEIMSEVSK